MEPNLEPNFGDLLGSFVSQSTPAPAAPLVLLAGTAGTHFIPPGCGDRAPRFTRVGSGIDLPLRQPSRHVRDEQQPSRRCWSGESIFAFAPWGVTEARYLGRGVRSTSSVKVGCLF
jgi:hypothetical protein